MVHGMTLLLSFEQDCEQFAREVAEQLSGAGLQVIRSFDLQVARAAHPGYACPHHGTGACTCQLIVLLVYGQDGLPTTLVLHGHDGRTQIFVVDRPEQRVDARQANSFLNVLSSGINRVSHAGAPGVA